MPPELSELSGNCLAHGPLMKCLGTIEAYQKTQHLAITAIQATLIRWEEEAKIEATALAEQKTKNKIIWAGLGTAAVAGISAGIHILIKKIGF